MSDIVVDSSVLANRILPKPGSVQAQRLVSEVALKGERLIALAPRSADSSHELM